MVGRRLDPHGQGVRGRADRAPLGDPVREATQETGGRALADARIHPDGPMFASLG